MKSKNKKVLSEKEIFSLIKKNKDVLKKFNVKKIGLFGSYVRGEQKENSDIDFLVEFDLTLLDKNFTGLFDSFMDLAFFLENLLGRKVDLITNGSLSPYVQPYVEKEVKWYETEFNIS